MVTRCILLSAVALLNAPGFAAAQQRIEHRRPDFAITIPAEFQRAEDAQGNLLLFTAPQGEKAAAISVKDLGMAIGLDLLRTSDIPPAMQSSGQIQVEHLPMRDIQVSVFVSRVSPQGVPLFIMGAQVPLLERGIQINVVGTSDREQGVRDVLSSVLSSFEGRLVSPSDVQGGAIRVRRLSVRERLAMLSWSVILVFGWFSLLAYLVLRLALIGRKDALLELRAKWLAVSAVCIVVGSSIRMIASRDPVDSGLSMFFALIALMVAFLVLRARGRLVQRRRMLARAPVASNDSPAAVSDGTTGQACTADSHAGSDS